MERKTFDFKIQLFLGHFQITPLFILNIDWILASHLAL